MDAAAKSASDVRVRPLRDEDLDRVVELHCERFATSRTTRFGKPFLRRMYKWFLLHAPQFALAAEVNGRVEGFIVGSFGAYSQRIFRFAIPQLIWGAIRQPGLIFDPGTYRLWPSYLRELLPSGQRSAAQTEPEHADAKRVHSASIAVSQKHMGLGIDLMEAFEAVARREGVDVMSCSVESSNVRVIQFCQKLGWQILRQKPQHVSLFKPLRGGDEAAGRKESTR